MAWKLSTSATCASTWLRSSGLSLRSMSLRSVISLFSGVSAADTQSVSMSATARMAERTVFME